MKFMSKYEEVYRNCSNSLGHGVGLKEREMLFSLNVGIILLVVRCHLLEQSRANYFSSSCTYTVRNE
jgi:hypothetical protein